MDVMDSLRRRIVEGVSEIQLDYVGEIIHRNTQAFWKNVTSAVSNRRQRETRRRIELLREYYSRPPISKQKPGQTMVSEKQTSSMTPFQLKSNRRKLSSTNSTLSYISSDVSSEDDDCFFSETPSYLDVHKDSISGTRLQDNEIQLTINHEQKRNLLTVTIHRVNISALSSDIKKIFARVYVVPGKLQKQNSKSICINKASRWEHDFKFKKLTIGQLEDCSVRIQIFSKSGLLKVPVRIGKVSFDLRDVTLTDFKTTILTLET